MKKYWVGALLLIATPASAILPYAISPAEEAMCQARVYSRPDARHIPHYCDGLRFLDRAYAAMRNKNDMRHYINVAINNFDYALGHTSEDNVMRGEVHINKARALKLAGKKGEAMAEFTKALRYNPDSPDVYQALADYHQETGNKPKALEMATEGLKRNPSSKGLKRRYIEFGGKLPYPEAVNKTTPVEEVRAEIKPVEKLETAPSSGASTSQESASTKPAAPMGPTSETEAPKIGSPKNPYCRFCPD